MYPIATSLLLFLAPVAMDQDTVVLHANNAPVWGEAPVLVEEVRIGSLAGPEETSFGQVGGIAVMPDGTIWIGDNHLNAIRRFDESGAFLGQVGRKGEGPGEFAYPGNIRLLSDNSVAVWDAGRIRVSRFDTSGVFLDSFRPPTIMIGSLIHEELEADSAGYLYVLGSTSPINDSEPRRMLWIKLEPSGQVLDSVFFFVGAPAQGTVDLIRTQSALSPLGDLVVGRNDDLAFSWTSSNGIPYRLEKEWEPVPYQSDEREEKERLEKGYSARNGKSPRKIPRAKPPFSHFEIDSEGRFWVHMYSSGFSQEETPGEKDLRERYNGLLKEWRQPFVCEVIHPKGEFLGRLEFPNHPTDVVWAKGQQVWVIERGELHEQYLVRYRIQPGTND